MVLQLYFIAKNMRKKAKLLLIMSVKMSVEMSGVNSTQTKILKLIKKNKNITQKELATLLKTTIRTIERNISTLKNKELIQRIGTDKKGYWKLL